MKTVNSAYSRFHSDLEHMRADAKMAKAIVENADKQMKDVRQSAVKAIHATSTCASGKHDDDDRDEDNDDNDDNDEHSSREGNVLVVLFSNLQSLFGNHTVTVNTTTNTNTTFTGDPQQIAEQAVALMQSFFDDAKAQLADLATPSPRATRTPKATAKADSHHGRNDSQRHEREGDDH